MTFRHPADAIAAGLTFVPGNRADALLHAAIGARQHRAAVLGADPRTGAASRCAHETARVAQAIERLADRHPRAGRGAAAVGRQPAEGDHRALDRDRGATRCCCSIRRAASTCAPSGRSIRWCANWRIRARRSCYYTSELAEVQLACDRVVVIFDGTRGRRDRCRRCG